MSMIEDDLRFHLRRVKAASTLTGLMFSETKASGYLEGLHAGGAISGDLYMRMSKILRQAAQRRDNRLAARKAA